MLDRTYRLASWLYFSEECERLKSLFSSLDYPHHLINSTITFIKVGTLCMGTYNVVKTQLKDFSIKLQTTIQPVFFSQKIGQDLKGCETRPQLVNQECVVYQFKCNLFDTGSYVGYTCGRLYARVDGHNSTSSSLRKHYDNDHAGSVPEDILSCNFNVYFNLESHNFKASRRASRFQGKLSRFATNLRYKQIPKERTKKEMIILRL